MHSRRHAQRYSPSRVQERERETPCVDVCVTGTAAARRRAARGAVSRRRGGASGRAWCRRRPSRLRRRPLRGTPPLRLCRSPPPARLRFQEGHLNTRGDISYDDDTTTPTVRARTTVARSNRPEKGCGGAPLFSFENGHGELCARGRVPSCGTQRPVPTAVRNVSTSRSLRRVDSLSIVERTRRENQRVPVLRRVPRLHTSDASASDEFEPTQFHPSLRAVPRFHGCSASEPRASRGFRRSFRRRSGARAPWCSLFEHFVQLPQALPRRVRQITRRGLSCTSVVRLGRSLSLSLSLSADPPGLSAQRLHAGARPFASALNDDDAPANLSTTKTTAERSIAKNSPSLLEANPHDNFGDRKRRSLTSSYSERGTLSLVKVPLELLPPPRQARARPSLSPHFGDRRARRPRGIGFLGSSRQLVEATRC